MSRPFTLYNTVNWDLISQVQTTSRLVCMRTLKTSDILNCYMHICYRTTISKTHSPSLFNVQCAPLRLCTVGQWSHINQCHQEIGCWIREQRKIKYIRPLQNHNQQYKVYFWHSDMVIFDHQGQQPVNSWPPRPTTSKQLLGLIT